MTSWEKADHHLGCFYSGLIDGDTSSAVSVDLCYGMVSQRFKLKKIILFFYICIL